jgi:hypothetical protein
MTDPEVRALVEELHRVMDEHGLRMAQAAVDELWRQLQLAGGPVTVKSVERDESGQIAEIIERHVWPHP